MPTERLERGGAMKHDTLSIQSKIHIIRGQRVMIDSDIAEMYGIETRRLNEQVKRNANRFPDSFMFQLTSKELEILKSQFATSSWGGSRKLPFAFTEHGVLMLASVLSSDTAIRVSIKIIQVFTKMREILSENSVILKRIESIESRLGANDKQFVEILAALKELYGYSEKEKRKKIGF